MFLHDISYLTGRTVQETFMADENLKAKVEADGPDSVKGFPVKIIGPHTVELCENGDTIDGQIFKYETVDNAVSVTTVGNVEFACAKSNIPTNFATETIVAAGSGKVKKIVKKESTLGAVVVDTKIRLLDTKETADGALVICKL